MSLIDAVRLGGVVGAGGPVTPLVEAVMAEPLRNMSIYLGEGEAWAWILVGASGWRPRGPHVRAARASLSRRAARAPPPPFKGESLHEGWSGSVPARAPRGVRRCLAPDHDLDHAHRAGAGGTVSRRVGESRQRPARPDSSWEAASPDADSCHRAAGSALRHRRRVVGLGAARMSTSSDRRASWVKLPTSALAIPNGRASQYETSDWSGLHGAGNHPDRCCLPR